MAGNVKTDQVSENTSGVGVSIDGMVCKDTAIYFGPVDTDGSWRIVISSTKLSIEKRESGSYVSKFKVTP